MTIEGILHDPDSNEIVAEPFEEEAVRVEPKRNLHVDFDAAPRTNLVDVRVWWNKQPARDAAVAARGLPQSLRYARDGTTKLRVPRGRHTILVGRCA